MPIRRVDTPPLTHEITRGQFKSILTPAKDGQSITITYLHNTARNAKGFWGRPTPENSEEVVLRDDSSAPTLAQGKILARAALEKLAAGEITGELKPLQPRLKPERLQEISHPTLPIKAIILRWDTKFTIRTIGYVKTGYTFPVASPSITQDLDYEWGRLDLMEYIETDTEEEAIQAANDELTRLADSKIPFKQTEGPC